MNFPTFKRLTSGMIAEFEANPRLRGVCTMASARMVLACSDWSQVDGIVLRGIDADIKAIEIFSLPALTTTMKRVRTAAQARIGETSGATAVR